MTVVLDSHRQRGGAPEIDPRRLGNRGLLDSYRALRRRINALEAQAAAVLGEIERRRAFSDDGHLSLTGWVMDATGAAPGVARSRVTSARSLGAMPATAAAYASGELDETRVRMLVKARDTDPEVFRRDEAALVDTAMSLTAGDLGRAVDHWRQAADERAFAAEADRVYRRRSLSVSATTGGMVRIDGDLDPESGAVVITAIGSLTDGDARDPGDRRTPTQRRADALTEICRRHLDRGDTPAVGGQRPHITVTVELETLEGRANRTCVLDHTGVITPQAARRLACDASISRVITTGPSETLDVGRSTRTVPQATRRALVARDRGCTWTGCRRPPQWCDAHHIQHWAHGGPTHLRNLKLLCRPHHRMTHQEDHPQRE